MPRINPQIIQEIKVALEKQKVFTFQQLVTLVNCSTRSGRTKLNQWQTYNSYNHNGKYYTLPSVPTFDENGLWYHNDICFSKHGTLKNTVVYLVSASTAGLTGNQLGEIVKISPRSFLHHFRNLPGIRRQKHEGVFVYFSDSPDIYKRQVQHHLEALKLPATITDTDAIDILIAIIKHHEITVEELAQLPDIKGRFSLSAIRDFMERNGLVKKTSNIER